LFWDLKNSNLTSCSERLAVHEEKRIGHVAGGADGHDPLPVAGKSFRQFKGRLDEIAGDPPLGDEIEDGEQEQGLVRRAEGGGLGPAVPVFVRPEFCEGVYIAVNLSAHLPGWSQ